jgi:hypothetical protein
VLLADKSGGFTNKPEIALLLLTARGAMPILYLFRFFLKPWVTHGIQNKTLPESKRISPFFIKTKLANMPVIHLNIICSWTLAPMLAHNSTGVRGRQSTEPRLGKFANQKAEW